MGEPMENGEQRESVDAEYFVEMLSLADHGADALDEAMWEAFFASEEFAKITARAERDIAAGRVLPIREPLDEFFDEDAVVCECGHIARSHASRAMRYACCVEGCACAGLQGAANDATPTPPPGAR